MRHVFLSNFIFVILFWTTSFAASNQSIVYQGRIIRPDGSVLNSGTVAFTLNVYSPAPGKCLLYSENQSLNMNGSVGMFSLALGAGTRTDGLAHAFPQIFVNGGTLSGLTCASGATTYSPAATDDRIMEATFNDSGTVVNLSAMNIKSVPFALQAAEIGGFGVNDIVKIHPTTGSATTFTTAEMAKAKTITGLSCAVNEIIKWNGTAWACSSDATGGSPSDASYLAKGVVQIDTDAATSGLSVASGVLKLSDVNSNVGTYGSATKTVTLTVNAQGRITAASHQDIAIPASQITQSSASNGDVLKWNGSAWAPAADAGTTTDASYAAKGLVQFDTNEATSGMTVASGVAKVNFGIGANQIVKLDGSARLPAVDGSALTNLPASALSGTLAVGNGGTGATTFTSNGVLLGNGTSAVTATAAGAAYSILRVPSGGGAPVFGSIDLSQSAAVTGTLAVGNGGTGTSFTFGANALVVANGTGSALTSMTCATGQILKWNSTSWGCVADSFSEDGNNNIIAGTNAFINNTLNNTKNVILGYEAGMNMRPAAGTGMNVAIGNEVLRGSPTPANNTGTFNIAIGDWGLRELTSGDHNIALGENPLVNNTSGVHNVAIGHDTLKYNMTGGRSVAIGPEALKNIMSSNANAGNIGIGANAMNGSAVASANTGINNIAVGINSLYSITTGEANAAIGRNSLYYLTTGRGNTGIGLNALNSSTTAGHQIAVGEEAQMNMRPSGDAANISFGYRAMRGSGTVASNTGTGNIAAGHQALRELTSGSDNYAFGLEALINTSTGDNNIAMGPWALSSNTTGSNNFALGWQALVGNEVASNNIGIGLSALASNRLSDINIAIGLRAQERMDIGTIIDGGNIAIGREAIRGSATVANNTGGWNVGIGDHALMNVTTGQLNVAIGDNPIQNLTTGQRNVGLGSNPLEATTTGSDNVAIGPNSLMSNTTGGDSVAIGSWSQELMRSAGHNIALGSSSLRGSATPANNTGTFNVALGPVTLYETTSGNYNTAIGNASLRNNTSGTENIAIGREALHESTTSDRSIAIGTYAQYYMRGAPGGSNNIAIGTAALQGSATPADNTGVQNIAIGQSVMEVLTEGGGNVGLGDWTFFRLTEGARNTAIGYHSGYHATNELTTGSYNTFLGSLSSLGSTTQRNYATAVGYDSKVDADATIVLGRAAEDRVVIGATGTANATYKFHVTTDATRTAIGGNAAWSTTSDARYKTNVTPIANALDIINNLQGVRFDWDHEKYPNQFDPRRQVGFIAQQVEKHVPEIVNTDENGFKAVQYSQLVAVLTEAVKELYAQFRQKSSEQDVQMRRIASELEKKNAEQNIKIQSLTTEVQKKDSEIQLMRSYLCKKDPAADFCR